MVECRAVHNLFCKGGGGNQEENCSRLLSQWQSRSTCMGADLGMLKGGGGLILCRAIGSNFVLRLTLRKAVHRGV